jgi:hypothetical protein
MPADQHGHQFSFAGTGGAGTDTYTAMELILRRANASRISGKWQDEDYDVFDGERDVGRIYLVDSYGDREKWFWGVGFQLTGRKSYGHAPTLDEAKAAFKAQYVTWRGK